MRLTIETKKEDTKMITNFSWSLFIFFMVNCSFSQSPIALEEYLNIIFNKNYTLETWDIYYEGFNLNMNNIREKYNETEEIHWINKKDVNIQITGTVETQLIRFYSRNLDDVLIGISNKKDSLILDYPIDFGNRLTMSIPKKIPSSGYEKRGLKLDLVSTEVLRVSVLIENENRSIHYWIDKNEGLVFMYSSSEYSKIIGIPK